MFEVFEVVGRLHLTFKTFLMFDEIIFYCLHSVISEKQKKKKINLYYCDKFNYKIYDYFPVNIDLKII